MKRYIYSDASYSKAAKLAVMGYVVFNSDKEHDAGPASSERVQLFEITEDNNIRAEIRSAIWALKTCGENQSGIVEKIVLYTDCQTVSNLVSRRERLEKLNFISQSKKKPLANTDLYREFYKIYDLYRPEICWVKGHSVKAGAGPVERNFSVLDKEVRAHLRKRLAAIHISK